MKGGGNMGHASIYIIAAVPMFIIFCFIFFIGRIKQAFMLRKCLSSAGSADTFKYKDKYYDKNKYSQLFKKNYRKTPTVDQLRAELKGTKEYSSKKPNDELLQMNVSILQQMISDKFN
jgi:hypothetical protein